jgi:nucleoside-diphosphate-sugar epimerase
MRVAVTGAAGFIGSHLVERLLLEGIDVVALDSLSDDLYPSNVKSKNWDIQGLYGSRIERINIDLREMIDPEILTDCEAIFHLAAMPGLTLSWTNTKLYIDSNLLATCNLMSVCESVKNLKFFHISTSSVYGKSVTGDENSPLNPISPYGVTKLAAEKAVIAMGSAKDINYNILRLFSVYGPRQRPDMAFNIFIRKILLGDQIQIFGDGTQSRANTFVKDIVEGIFLAFRYFEPGEIYNLSGKEELSVNEILSIMEEQLGKTADIVNVGERLGDQQRTVDVSSKALRQIGYNPGTNISKGIAEQIKWQRELLQ